MHQRQTIIIALTFLTICSFVGTENEKIQKDLRLTVTHEQTAKQNGDGILKLSLTNSSSTDKYKIVLPGDGSENAWREPYIYFTSDFKKDKGNWEKLEFHKPLRCGNYDSNWQKETLTISPKQTVQIYESIFQVKSFFAIKSSGTIRLTVHYDYAQGKHFKKTADTSSTDIVDIPAFTLTSDTIAIKIKK